VSDYQLKLERDASVLALTILMDAMAKSGKDEESIDDARRAWDRAKALCEGIAEECVDAPLDFYAKTAYNSYGRTTKFKNFRGDPMPAWDDLPEQIRTAWRASVGDVTRLCFREESSESKRTIVSKSGSD